MKRGAGTVPSLRVSTGRCDEQLTAGLRAVCAELEKIIKLHNSKKIKWEELKVM